MADSPVERLIDQGLERYGKGDLDGALVAWESALALNPDDERAAGYVEYVRGNYELLRGEGGAAAESELAVPFGLVELHDSDRYEIEISEEAQRARIEAFIDRVDDGWFLDEDGALPTIARPLPLPARPDSIDAPIELELEADEPEGDDRAPPIGPFTQPRNGSASGDDDKTNDFGTARLSRLADFEGAHPFDDPAETRPPSPPPAEPASAPAAPGAKTDEGDTGDFDYDESGHETAEVGKQHLGFVKVAGEEPSSQVGAGFAGPEASTASLRVRVKPDDLRSGSAAPADGAAELELPEPPSEDLDKSGTLDLGPPGSIELEPTGAPAGAATASSSAASAASADDDERTQERGRWARARSPHASSSSSALDLELDDGGSPSIAPPVIIDDPVLSEPGSFDPTSRNMPTREIPGLQQRLGPREARDSKTKDFPPVKTSTPTRDFPPVPTTAKTIPRAARVATPAPEPLAPAPVTIAPLLAEIDAAAPAGESADDRTRRRVTALLDRATAASKDGRHADAVAACDLALAEAPDSAVAQKLVHRSRDAILAVYQGFLGDLAARPTLAVPMHELPREQIDSRAAFLLSRVDGNISYEEILDVSGMTRLEALRHLARLVARGILSVR